MCGCTGNVSNNQDVVNRKTSLSKCPELYETLRSIDLRVINLLNINNSDILRETNRQLRIWMRNLNKYCPSQEEIEILEQFVNNEENI